MSAAALTEAERELLERLACEISDPMGIAFALAFESGRSIFEITQLLPPDEFLELIQAARLRAQAQKSPGLH